MWHIRVHDVITEQMFYAHPHGAQEWVNNMPRHIVDEHRLTNLPAPRLRRHLWLHGDLDPLS